MGVLIQDVAVEQAGAMVVIQAVPVEAERVVSGTDVATASPFLESSDASSGGVEERFALAALVKRLVRPLVLGLAQSLLIAVVRLSGAAVSTPAFASASHDFYGWLLSLVHTRDIERLYTGDSDSVHIVN